MHMSNTSNTELRDWSKLVAAMRAGAPRLN
jgi:hypothetical protein